VFNNYEKYLSLYCINVDRLWFLYGICNVCRSSNTYDDIDPYFNVCCSIYTGEVVGGLKRVLEKYINKKNI